MTLHPTLEGLKALKLFGMLKALEAHLETPGSDKLSFDERFGMLDSEMNYSKEGSSLLFQVISARYERLSTLITTNLEFSEWGEYSALKN